MSKPVLMKKVQEFINKLEKKGGKPLYELTPQEARQVLKDVQNIKVPMADADVVNIAVPVAENRQIAVEIVKPKGAKEPLPVIYYIHGGGWVMGDEETHERLIRDLAAQINAAVVFPIYRPAPEGRFPETVKDIFAALQYVVKEAGQYNLDASRLAVAGDSVGGNMAAVMTILAKQNGFSPKIDFQLLFYPVTAADFKIMSYEEFSDGPWLTMKAMEWFWDAYLPDKSQRKSILASPLNATVEELEGLPPALIITDENDVLRDEGEAYARKLNEAEVEVAAVRFNGTIHDFAMLNELAETAPTRTAILLATAKLHEVFYGAGRK